MPFEPGVSGNPAGTPGPKHNKLFRDALALAVKRTQGDKTDLARIAEALVEKAKEGDVPAINAVADRLDGKPAQAIGGSDELPPIRARFERVIIDSAKAGDSEGVQASSGAETV